MSPLTERELEVMQVLWEHGEQKPSEIQGNFSRPITNMALRSVLQILVEKGHANRQKIGKAYYYSHITPRNNAIIKMTQHLANILTGGSAFALIAKLVETEKLSEEHIEELKRIASETNKTEYYQQKEGDE